MCRENNIRLTRWAPSRNIAASPTDSAVRPVRGRHNRQLAAPLVDPAHRLDSVDDQIEKHLLQLHPVTPHERQTLCKLCLE
jgi:hypothetical protein